MTNKPVLMVAYLFPPHGGGGVQRTVKFAKYLPRHGYDPIVLTADHKTPALRDTTYDAELPERVIRVPEKLRGAIAVRLAEYISFPDAHGSWGRDAINAGVELVRANKIKVVYSTAGPYQNHIVGRAIASTCSLPWIADFRDLWTTNPVYVARTPIHRAIHRIYERRFYRDATGIICASPTQKKNLIEKLHIPEEKVHVITNGFDPGDVPTDVSARTEALRLSYLGSFYAGYRPDDFVKALEKLQQTKPEIASRIRMRFVGDFDRATIALFKGAKLGEPLDVQAYVPHGQLKKIHQETDMYLLYLPPMSGPIGAMIPQKLYEYLSAGKTIFAVLPDSDAREILEHTGGAILLRPGDVDGIVHALEEAVVMWRQKKLPRPGTSIKRFTRERLTGQLADILDSVL